MMGCVVDRTIIFEVSDNEDFQIFGYLESMVSYALALQGCSELSSNCTNISQGLSLSFNLVCLYQAVDARIFHRHTVTCYNTNA